MGDGAQAFYDRIQPRQHDFIARRLKHQRVAQVVDVFGGAGEVDKFSDPRHFAIAAELFFQEVFNRFDVVIGDRLDLLHECAVGV